MNHLLFVPPVIIFIKVNLILLKSSVELGAYYSGLNDPLAIRINEVSISCDSEPHKGDGHTIIIEKNIWVGAVCMCVYTRHMNVTECMHVFHHGVYSHYSFVSFLKRLTPAPNVSVPQSGAAPIHHLS